ncbi:hypothetical protein GCM10018987_28070 [Streptomyces cremeus]
MLGFCESGTGGCASERVCVCHFSFPFCGPARMRADVVTLVRHSLTHRDWTGGPVQSRAPQEFNPIG